jgi:ubiquinone/menaquinone biosynthesis C-methylase UbiE
MGKMAKGYKGIGMDGFIATWYAKITQKEIESYQNDARRVAERVIAGAAVLEIAPGPGYLAIELARLGSYKITGLDISAKFVEIAREKAQEAGVDIDFRQGDAAQMPFPDASFDFIICRSAFKNFAQPVHALNEMRRALKPAGTALIIDLRGDVSPETITNYVNHMGLSRLNTLITRWTFRHMLIKRAYTQEEFNDLLSRSDIKNYRIQPDSIGLEIWIEK